jgi:PAS domain S-box-containing protein
LSQLKPFLLDNLETYKDLFDHAHDLIHVVAPDGSILYVNNAWKNILGYAQEQVEARSIYDFVDQADQDRFISYRKNVIAGEAVDNEIVVNFIASNRNTITLEGFVSAKVIDGKPLYTRGIFRDITLKLQNEAKLREREASLQQLLFYAPDAIIVIDEQSIINYWNPKAEEIFGYKTNEVLGKSLTQIIIPEQYREAHDNGMKRYLTTGEAHVLNKTIEITALNRDGREFYISLTVSTTKQQGRVAFIAFVRDIDEQKRNAIELAQKKEQLEISNAELEQFAHVASHDMKEPIRKIRIFTEQVKGDIDNVLSPKSLNHIRKIEVASARLIQMIEGVLAYSSIKAHEIEKEKVNLNDIIKDVENDFELIIQQKNALLKYEKLPVIEGASFLLYQLFYNLINNALKFSRPHQDPIIEITVNKLNDDQLHLYPISPTLSYIEIVVRDNGVGFSQEHAEKIFKTFTRLHAAGRYEGTGLGLSLCRNIVQKHKGHIYALGEENKGTSFVVLLPGTLPEAEAVE